MPPAPSAQRKLRGDPEFRRVLETGTRTSGKLLAAHVLAVEGETRVRFIAGRAVGGAVVRNRARRLMREAWRRLEPSGPARIHAVFVARVAMRTATTDDVAAEMTRILQRSIGQGRRLPS